jgi:pimeloyl-ACP methyl ester carboxylesterase
MPHSKLWSATLTLCALLLPAFPGRAETAREEIVLETEDGWQIHGTLHLPAALEKAPAVLLIHQGGSDRGEWAPYIPPLVARGYAVLAYDVRGHGASGKVEDLRALFDDPGQAPRDLDAAIAFLRDHPAVDELRIGVVGSSIGANLAVVANHHYGLPGVALAGKTSAARNLAGLPEGEKLELRSLFFLAAAGDQDGQRAAWARELYDLTQEPRQLHIVEGSATHGVGVFEEAPLVFERVLRWLKARL